MRIGGTYMNDTQSPQAGSGKVEVTLLDILKLLLSKSYWLLLAGVLAGACVFLVTTFLITPSYESRVSFYVYNSTNKGGIYIIRKFFGIILLAISVRLFMANISLLLDSFHH